MISSSPMLSLSSPDSPRRCSSSSSLPSKAKGPPRRNVSFSLAVEVVVLEKQDPELYPELYYSASELRRFRQDSRRQQQLSSADDDNESPTIISPGPRRRTRTRHSQQPSSGRWGSGGKTERRTFTPPRRHHSSELVKLQHVSAVSGAGW